jgi:hypothetical protein
MTAYNRLKTKWVHLNKRLKYLASNMQRNKRIESLSKLPYGTESIAYIIER